MSSESHTHQPELCTTIANDDAVLQEPAAMNRPPHFTNLDLHLLGDPYLHNNTPSTPGEAFR